MASNRELEQLLKRERARSERLEKKPDEMMKWQEQFQQQISELVRKLNEAVRAANGRPRRSHAASASTASNARTHTRSRGCKPGVVHSVAG